MRSGSSCQHAHVRTVRFHRLGACLAIASFAVGCPSSAPERRWVTCTCEYVTDFDQPGHVDVDVCSEESDPHSAAESCARGTGVGAVTACRCNAPAQGACGASASCRVPGVR